MLTAARLRERLHYDPETGVFTWKQTASRRVAGKRAGRKHKKRGYREIYIDNKLYYAQRLAWLYMTGDWPLGLVDHRDHDKDNNAWLNLRDGDYVRNGQNRAGAQRNSVTGVLGVSPQSNGSGYRARIVVNGAEVALGTFATIEQAQAARQAAKPLLHAW